jgi:hypothetical protein
MNKRGMMMEMGNKKPTMTGMMSKEMNGKNPMMAKNMMGRGKLSPAMASRIRSKANGVLGK